MFPVMLDLKQLQVVLIGEGQPLRRRMMDLRNAGAKDVRLFANDVDKVLEISAGKWLNEGMPGEEDIEWANLVLIAGLPQKQAESYAELAREKKVLVNVEDMRQWCDFYYPAFTRRGALVVAVSTSGSSPVVAQEVRDLIAKQFGPEWDARMKEVTELRDKLYAEGHEMKKVAELTRVFLSEKGWMKEAAENATKVDEK